MVRTVFKSITAPLIAALFLCLVALPALALEASEVGVVLMHGKWGSPNRNIDQLAASLRRAGYKVATPDMPWSQSRNYDKTYQQAMAEIEFSCDVLKASGAKRIVVAGHSLGANAALAYGATHPGLLGVVVIAPGHTPDLPDVRARLADKLEEARAMVKAGHGDDDFTYTDVNQGKMKSVTTGAAIFVSFNDPEGLASMPVNTVRQTAPTMIVIGSEDRIATLGEDYLFNRLPPSSQNRYLTVEGGHLETPTMAKAAIVEWIDGLR